MNDKLRLDAIILGGGQGRRLWPLTQMRAKPAVQIGGKYRLIDIPLSNCINSDIKHIHILTQFNTASLHRHIFQTYKFDIFSRGNIELLAAQQTLENVDWFQGTADAVRSYWKRFSDLRATHFIILAGDHLYKMDYRDFFQVHLDNNADITIAAKPMSVDRTSQFGIIKCDESNLIIDFMEKPKTNNLSEDSLKDWISDGHVLASMGIYIFKKDILGEVLHMEGNDFGKNIIPTSIQKYHTSIYRFEDYWEDIGTIGSFFNANIALTHSKPEFSFYDARNPIYTHPRFLPGSRLADTKIVQSFISEGCIVGKAEIKHSILGMRSIVGDGVLLERVYHMGADFYESELENNIYPKIGIGSGSVLKNVILDKNVRIGKHVVLENRNHVQKADGDFYFIREGIIVIPKGTVIPDNTVI